MSHAVGQLQSIWRFPIKSFQGESIDRTWLSETGILGDRILALRNTESGKIVSGKHAKLGERVLEIEAFFEGEITADRPLPPLKVRVGDKTIRADDSSALSAACSNLLNHPVELVSAGPGSDAEIYDSYWPEVKDHPLAGASIDLPLPLAESGSFADLEPLHLLTTASLQTLAQHAESSQIDVSRFRPSFVVDTRDAAGFVENEWAGCTASIGSVELELGSPAPRCIMTTRAQAGLPRDPDVLRTLVKENRQDYLGMMMPCLGIYAKVTKPGEIAVGDSFRLNS